MLTIAVDAMGGDHGPSVIIDGAIRAVNDLPIRLILVGQKDVIESKLKGLSFPKERVEIRHSTQVALMGESPLQVLRKKKDTSIRVAFQLVKEGNADAVVSAGHSGVTMATGAIILGKIQGVERPGLASVFPAPSGPVVVIDVGANVDCSPIQLFQFALMADIYAKYILDLPNPRIGLLSIGEEDTKGNEVVRQTHALLRQSGLNFIGNVEGRDFFSGKTDIIVCDGFVGNVSLKLCEGLAEAIQKLMGEEISEYFRAKLGYLLMKPALRSLKRRLDYAEYGGVPLLGINGVGVICHGGSPPKAIRNAIKVAMETAQKGVTEKLRKEMNRHEKLLRGLKVANHK